MHGPNFNWMTKSQAKISALSRNTRVFVAGDPRDVLLGVLQTINVSIATLILYAGGTNLDIGFMRFCYVFSLVLASLTLYSQRRNALFAARTLLLLLPGYFAVGVQLVNPNLYYSFYEPAPQTLDISLIIYALTSLAFAGSEIGLRMGRLSSAKKSELEPLSDEVYFYPLVIPVLALSYYVSLMYGASLLDASYASGTGMSGLGAANSICAILLFSMYAHYLSRPTPGKGILLAICTAALLVFGILIRGGRQDVLSCLFGGYVIFWVVRRRGAPITLQMLCFVVPLMIFMEFFGFLRYQVITLNTDYFAVFNSFLNSYLHPEGVVSLSTFSPIASTFSNTVFAVRTGVVGLIHGRSYIDYIPRTPPEFLYPDRPQDYALIFSKWNMTTGGGFFELAEAYLNFGWFGAVLVPAVISFWISRAFHSAIIRQSVGSYFALFALLSVILRGILYQTFAFYKASIAALLIMLVLRGVAMFVRRGDRNRSDGIVSA